MDDYFSASSDQEATEVFHWGGGPSSPPRGQLAKDFVETKIEAYSQMGRLEALLTGHSYEEITQRQRHVGALLPLRGVDSERGVVTLTDEFAYALATATDEQLSTATEAWAQTDVFLSQPDAAELEEIVRELRGLAQRARREGKRLYCWSCL